jgi:hypothetical protein
VQEFIWLVESVRAYFEGGWEGVRAVPGFWVLVLLFIALVPPTLIMMGIGDDSFDETPLGQWLGVESDDGWPPPRTIDIDGDGRPDC